MAAATMPATSSSRMTSASMATALPPAASMPRTVATLSSALSPAQATAAPSLAKRSAVARPMPEPAPVTTAVLPSSLMCLCSPSWPAQDSPPPRGLRGLTPVPASRYAGP